MSKVPNPPPALGSKPPPPPAPPALPKVFVAQAVVEMSYIKPGRILTQLQALGIDYIAARHKWKVGEHEFPYDKLGNALRCWAERRAE